jgi:rubrerythrin
MYASQAIAQTCRASGVIDAEIEEKGQFLERKLLSALYENMDGHWLTESPAKQNGGMVMKCPSCGVDVFTENAQFCPSCGKQME